MPWSVILPIAANVAGAVISKKIAGSGGGEATLPTYDWRANALSGSRFPEPVPSSTVSTGSSSGSSSGGPAWLGPAINVVGQLGAGLIGSKASGNASDLQYQYNLQALEFEKQKEAERQREWNLLQEQQRAKWEAMEALRAPYRAASRQALGTLADRYGMQLPASEIPQFKPMPMPANWDGTTPPDATTMPVSPPQSASSVGKTLGSILGLDNPLGVAPPGAFGLLGGFGVAPGGLLPSTLRSLIGK